MYFTININAHGIPLRVTGEWQPAKDDAKEVFEVSTVHQGDTPITFEKETFKREYGGEIITKIAFRNFRRGGGK